MLVVVVHSFLFVFHFVVVLHFYYCLHSLLFNVIPHPSVNYRRFLHPFYTFISAHHWVICDTLILSEIFFHSITAFWVGIFYPQVFFTLYSITKILPAFIKFSLGVGSSSLKFAGLHADPQNTGPAHLFVRFTAIHNLHIQKNSFLNSTKYYHELLVVKV